MIPELKTVVTEKSKNAVKTEQEVKATPPTQPDALVTAVQGPLEKFMEAARVEAVVGAPIKHGDSLVIPTAEVFNAMGFGIGSGQAQDEDKANVGAGSGGGGGGQALARPVAVIIMSPTGVRVEPVVDVTKIGLAVFTAAGFIGAMLWRMSRSRPAK
jgi:uncharacterized spore protein YtfJ